MRRLLRAASGRCPVLSGLWPVGDPRGGVDGPGRLDRDRIQQGTPPHHGCLLRSRGVDRTVLLAGRRGVQRADPCLSTEGSGHRAGIRRRRRRLQRRRHPVPFRVAAGPRRRCHPRADRRPRHRGRHRAARRGAAPRPPGGRPQRRGGRRSTRWRRPASHDGGGRDTQRVGPSPGGRPAGHGGSQPGHHRPGRGAVRRGATRTAPAARRPPAGRRLSRPGTDRRPFADRGDRQPAEPTGRASGRARRAAPALGAGQGREGCRGADHRRAGGGQVPVGPPAQGPVGRRPPPLGGDVVRVVYPDERPAAGGGPGRGCSVPPDRGRRRGSGHPHPCQPRPGRRRVPRRHRAHRRAPRHAERRRPWR